MANKEEATLLIRIKQIGAEAFSTIKKGIDKISEAGKVALGSLKLLSAGLTAVGAFAYKSAKAFGEFEGVRKSFTALAESQGQDAKKMLANMRELSSGMVSDADLMKKANNALLLGLPVDRFGDMLKIAKSASTATGESMDFMLQSITTGLGRGSKMILDNLGIVFKAEDANNEYAKSIGKVASQLTEAEKKQAFINKAISVGLENAKKTGSQNLTVAQSMEVLNAQWQNAYIVIGEAAAPAVQFFTETLGELFQSSNTAVNESMLQDFFNNTAKVVTVIKGIFITAGQAIGTVIGGVGLGISQLVNGQFSKAFQTVKFMGDELNKNFTDNAMTVGAELERIDNLYAQRAAEKLKENENKKLGIKREMKKIEMGELDAEQAAKIGRDILEAERELEFLNMTEQEKIMAKVNWMRQDIENFKGHAKEKALMQKQLAVEEKKAELAMTEFKKKQAEQKERDQMESLSKISTLARSNNQALAAGGKAAALTQIAIEGPVAVTKALSAFPPPFNFAAAAAVGAAVAAQAANVVGIKMADGGIVTPTAGGTQAIIGEAGRSEAVIPLPQDFDPDQGLGGLGGGATIVFNGPVMGDQAQARQFAIAVDRELYKLRQGNESIAFDEGVS